MNTAADFPSQVELDFKENLLLKFTEDILTEPIEKT